MRDTLRRIKREELVSRQIDPLTTVGFWSENIKVLVTEIVGENLA
jgi:hypothetical protein